MNWYDGLPFRPCSDDVQIGTVHQFRCRQHPVIAWTFLRRGDWIDKSLEGAHGTAMKPQETMLEQGRLNGEGGFVDKRQPSKRGGVGALVERHAWFRQ